MSEPELLFPVTCPVCSQESLTGFRISVVAEALQTFQLRLYANCHVSSWDASDAELAKMCEYLDAMWDERLPDECQQYSLNSAEDDHPVAHLYAGPLDEFEFDDWFSESDHP